MTPADLERLPGWPHRRCLSADPEAFFSADGEDWYAARRRLQATAQQYCAPCPIRLACGQAGQGREWGLWGGIARNHGGGSKPVDLLAPSKGA